MSTATLDRVDPASVTLRPAHWSDIATLAALDADLFADEAWSVPTWWSELAGRPRREYVVATRASRIVGYAGLDIAGDTADVMTIAVSAEARGVGLGRQLLDHLVERAGARRAHTLLLEVRADNEAARGLYARAGFEQISVRRRYYQPGDVDAIIMRRMTGKEEK